MDRKVIEDILTQPDVAKLVSSVLGKANPTNARRVAFWLLSPVSDEETTSENKLINLDETELIKLSQLVGQNKLSSTAAKEVFTELLSHGGQVEKIAKSKNLLQVSDENEISAIVRQVIKEQSQAAKDVQNGEIKAIGYLVGQVMKASQGRANPGLAQQLIEKQLGLKN